MRDSALVLAVLFNFLRVVLFAMSQNLHILRRLRLQLKTGFLTKEPSTYTYMKRYPPLNRDTAPPVRRIDKRNIPYYDLYEKAVSTNPLYADEKVYPAYWAYEPQALTLAKKQFEFMESGESETVAYDKAMDYVDSIENDSYKSLKALLDKSNNADTRLPFAANQEVMASLAQWKERLQANPYKDMELAEQGDLEYFLQTKVLKWNEVERERRMKDPIFVRQFEKLRKSLFAEVEPASEWNKEVRVEYTQELLDFFGLNRKNMTAEKPFFYQEYEAHFAQLKEKPVLAEWSEEDRVALSHWIIDTLAIREVLQNNSAATIQTYLDQVRAHFFPMIRYPKKALEFELPEQDEFRRILFDNNVGYKKQDDKLYVKRFYKLPQLLFPTETLATTLTTHNDASTLETVLGTENGLLNEINSAGYDEKSLPELQKQLDEFMSSNASAPSATEGGAGRSMDMTSLDALLSADEEEIGKAAAASRRAPSQSANAVQGGNSSNGNSRDEKEFMAMVKKHIRLPGTDLEKERDELFSSMEYTSWQNAQDEDDLSIFKRTRLENEVLARARLSVLYEQKESARRSEEWKNRGVWLDSLPSPALSLIDNRE